MRIYRQFCNILLICVFFALLVPIACVNSSESSKKSDPSIQPRTEIMKFLIFRDIPAELSEGTTVQIMIELRPLVVNSLRDGEDLSISLQTSTELASEVSPQIVLNPSMIILNKENPSLSVSLTFEDDELDQTRDVLLGEIPLSFSVKLEASFHLDGNEEKESVVFLARDNDDLPRTEIMEFLIFRDIPSELSEGTTVQIMIELRPLVVNSLRDGEDLSISLQTSTELASEVSPQIVLNPSMIILNKENPSLSVSLTFEDDGLDQTREALSGESPLSFSVKLEASFRLDGTKEKESVAFLAKDNDDLILVVTPDSRTLELDEADLSITRTFQIKLKSKPREDVTIYITEIRRSPITLSVSGEHTEAISRRGKIYRFLFTPENWDTARMVSAQLRGADTTDNGLSYLATALISAKYASESKFSSNRNRRVSYSLLIRDNDNPPAPITLEAFACNAGTHLYWTSRCLTSECRSGEETIEHEIFYSTASAADVSTASPSFRLTLAQSRASELNLLDHIQSHSHTGLANDTPVFYKMRIVKINTSTGLSENSDLSEEVTATPTASDDHAVFCLENGDGTTESPFRIKTAAHFQQMEYYRFASFQMENDIRLADDFVSLGQDVFGFLGRLDGAGYTISNVKRNIFRAIASVGGEVRDLQIEANIDREVPNTYCLSSEGGILADDNGGTITRVTSVGTASYTIAGSGSYEGCGILGRVALGGLIGKNRGSLQQSFSTVQINVQGKLGTVSAGHVTVGGLVGLNQNMVSNSFSTSTITVDDASLNGSLSSAGLDSRYVSYTGGVTGLDSNGGVTDTVFHALGILAVPNVSGGRNPDGFARTGAFHTALGENARLNSATTGGTWGDTTIWNLGSDSEYPCLIGLPDIANNPSDASIVCAVP